MDDKLPDFECDDAVVESVKVEKVDYSGKSLKELVKIFDKKLQDLSKAPSSQALTEVIDVKNAMSDKVNDVPLEDRAKFKKPLPPSPCNISCSIFHNRLNPLQSPFYPLKLPYFRTRSPYTHFYQTPSMP